MEIEKVMVNIRKELKDYIQQNKIKFLIIGVSGGIDSALCCALAKPVCDELNVPLIGRSIPIETNKQDEILRARMVGRELCTDFKEVNLTSLYLEEKSIFEAYEGVLMSKIAQGNLKARIRMKYLYWIAGDKKGIVLSTDNYTEYLLGFWTLHGDVGDLGMIQSLWKTEVYDLSDYIYGLTRFESLYFCIEAVPTDGLGITNSDLDQIMPNWNEKFQNCREAYKEVDRILQRQISSLEFNQIDIDSNLSVIKRYLASNFKRKNPYNFPRERIFK